MKELGMARSVFAASVVAVALALAGCGGGGDSDDRADQADAAVKDLRAQIANLEGQVETLTGERNTARGEVSDLEEMIGMMDDAANDAPSASLYAQLNAATEDAADLRTYIGMMDDAAAADGSLYARINYHMGEVSRLETAAGNADDMPSETGSLHAQIAYHMEQASNLRTMIGNPDDAAGSTSLHAQLNAANARATDLSDMIGNASDDASTAEGASLHAQLNHYKAEAKRLQGLVNLAADAQTVAKAKAVNSAIREAGAAVSVTNPAAPSVAVKASSAGSLSVTTTTAGYSDAGAAPDPEGLPVGWRGRMLTNAGGDMLVVYTDIEDSSGVTFISRYSATTTNGMTRFPIAVATDTGSIPWAAARRSDNTVSTSSQTVDGVLDRRRTFRGTVLDAPGTFTCSETGATSTDCVAPTADAATGVLTPATGWSFVPDAGALAQVSDTAYIALGWWLNKVDSDTYTFRRIAMAGGADLPAYDGDAAEGVQPVAGTAIRGTAKYVGGAAGKYSFLNEVLNEASAGHWTATAELTANFDADSDGNATDNVVGTDGVLGDQAGVSVHGTINGFETDKGAEDGWSVTLAAVDVNPVDGVQTPINTGPTTTVDGITDPVNNDGVATWLRGSDAAAKGTGAWNYTFYGDGAPTAGVSSKPTAITGMFSASIGTAAHITGVFGGQEEKEATP